jgi:site-specific DNA-methyltransferase (adenine-specific)
MVYEHYDKKEDGLSKDWYNVSTFVNPPYSQIKKWIDKVLIELQKRVDRQLSRGYGVHTVAPIVMLVPARTDTRWFWGTTYSNWVSVVFIKGRLKFSGSKNSAPFPSCLIVLSYDRGAPQLAQLGVDVLPCYKLKPLDD